MADLISKPNPEPELPSEAELIKIRVMFADEKTPTSKLVLKLVAAYVHAKQSVRDVLRASDEAVLGITRSADVEIKQLIDIADTCGKANTELRSQVADLETQARQAAANTAAAQLEIARLRAEVESLRPAKTITTENTAMCSHCGERMPCLYHNALAHIVDKALK